MGDRSGKDLLGKLADAGEGAIQRLADMPGAGKVMETMTSMRERIEDLQRRVSRLDSLEQRVAELERRVEGDGGARDATDAPASLAQGQDEGGEMSPPPPPPPPPGSTSTI